MRRMLFALVSAFSCTVANAAIVQVVATGDFSVAEDPNSYLDPEGLLPFAQPADGTTFGLTLLYDDATEDFAGSGDTAGLYFRAQKSIRLQFGAEDFATTTPRSVIVVNDDFNAALGEYGDGWFAWNTIAEADEAGGYLEYRIGLSLLTTSVTTPVSPLTTDALIQPFGPAGWVQANIGYSIVRHVIDTNGNDDATQVARAYANIDTITTSTVPVPAAVWLFGSALGLLGWARRRRT
ncbi:MAG: VPLPA-CTERM sorting domain-containing protein [Gammaproteobacteria bacterium]